MDATAVVKRGGNAGDREAIQLPLGLKIMGIVFLEN